MLPSEDVVRKLLKGDSEACMIFGSTARGDASRDSDIDILQLRTKKSKNYQRGNVNVSVYDVQTLSNMAAAGSLFVLHLKTEGKVLFDPNGTLKKCIDAYSPPASYNKQLQMLRELSLLLDIDEPQYASRFCQFNTLAVFLLRTLLYINSAESGHITFSIPAIAERLACPELAALSRIKRQNFPVWERFQLLRDVIGSRLNQPIRNPYGTIEALMVNTCESNPLVTSFGLRILGDEIFNTAYDTMSPYALGALT